MPTFLFWNLQKRPLLPQVERLVRAYVVDVLVLAEQPDGWGTEGLPYFRAVSESGDRLWLYDRTGADWQLVVSDVLGLWAGYRVVPQSGPGYTLFAAHLPSKLWGTPDDQRNTLAVMRDAILETESGYDERTVLVGDLNCDPFETGLVGIDGLHAVSSREVARRMERTVRGRQYKFLYNPMWGVFGDRTSGPPGTYYRAAGQAVNYYWNVFDQVLLRPALMDSLGYLRVLTEVDGEGLLTANGIPAADRSDHLPLLFRLDF